MNRSVTIVLYKGKGSQPYRWRLKAPNGRTLADSAEGYASATSVRRAVMKFGEWTVKGVIVEDTILPPASAPPSPPVAPTWAEAASASYTVIRDWVVKTWNAPAGMPKG